MTTSDDELARLREEQDQRIRAAFARADAAKAAATRAVDERGETLRAIHDEGRSWDSIGHVVDLSRQRIEAMAHQADRRPARRKPPAQED